jgi:hypothetical protein
MRPRCLRSAIVEVPRYPDDASPFLRAITNKSVVMASRIIDGDDNVKCIIPDNLDDVRVRSCLIIGSSDQSLHKLLYVLKHIR